MHLNVYIRFSDLLLLIIIIKVCSKSNIQISCHHARNEREETGSAIYLPFELCIIPTLNYRITSNVFKVSM